MNTFFSLERFTRLSVPLRLFRVLVWTLFVSVLGAGTAGQAQTSTQSTEYPPEYYWQQPITGFKDGNDPVQIVYAKYAYGNMGRTTSTDPDSLQFQKNITLLRNGIQLSPAEAQLDLQPVTSKDPASTSTAQYYDAWNPYAVLAPTSSNIRTASFGSYVSFDVANANRGDLNYFGPYYPNASRNVWSITFTLAKPDTASAVYTIRMRDKYGKVLDSNVTQVGVIPQGSAATFAVVKQPVNASVSSGSLMAFSVEPQNHLLGLLNTPFGVTSDGNGNVFIADTINNAIRKVSVGGRMTTIAGLDGQSLDFVNGTTAMILGGSQAGQILNGTRQLTAGTTTTVINRDRAPQAGFRDGTSDQRTGDGTTNPNTYRYDTTIVTGVTGPGPTSTEPLFNNPQGIAVADNGMLFVADTNNNAIRSITVNSGTATGTAVVNTVLGGPQLDNFNKPRAIALTGSLANYDGANPPSLWVVDSNNYRIQKITLDSNGAMASFDTIAGIGKTPGWSGTGTNVTQNFLSPSGLVVTADELTIYIADTANHVIRRLQRADKSSAVWNAVTLAGAVGLKGNVNEKGTEARLSFPTGLALDEINGFLYFTEFGNHGVRRLILPGGNSAQPYAQGGTLGAGLRYELQVEAVAGGGRALPNPINGTTGEGTGSNAGFNYPAGITFNNLDGSLILADSNNHVIRKITYLTNLSNNLDPNGSYNRLNTKSNTVEKVVVDTFGSVFSDGTVQTVDDKLVGNSVTLTGVATYAGNHDYTELTEYPNYEWLFWGEPIGYYLNYGINPGEYTGDDKPDLEIQSANYDNVGPYQVNITNYWGVGIFSNEVSGYVALGEQPKFLAPGYALFDFAGKRILNFGTLAGGSYTSTSGTQTAVGTQLSTFPDVAAKPLQLGDRISLKASILPGDEVTYQWQVTAESLKAVGGYVGGLGAPVEDYPWVNLIDGQTDFQTAGVSLQGHVFSGPLVSAGSLCVRDLLGTKGSLGLSRLIGATAATLQIEHFQQSFNGKTPPTLRFRVKSYKKGSLKVDAGTSATSLDTKTVVLVNTDTYTETLVDTTTLNTGTANDEDRTNGLLLLPNYPPNISDTQLLMNGSPASTSTGVADSYLNPGAVVTLTLKGAVSSASQATYQWYYLAPEKVSDPTAAVAISGGNGSVSLFSSGTVTLSGSLSSGSLSATGSLSAGGALPAGRYYVVVENGIGKVESQRLNLVVSNRPSPLPDELALRGSSFTFDSQVSSSDPNERVLSMGTSQAVSGSMSVIIQSDQQRPDFNWTFMPKYPVGLSGSTPTPISSITSVGTSGAANLYQATLNVSLGTTASGTYTVTAKVGTKQPITFEFPVVMQYSPRYASNSKLAVLTSGGTATAFPNPKSSQLPRIALSTPKTLVLSGSFSCAPGLDTQYVWRRNNWTIKSGTLSPSDNVPFAVPPLELTGIQGTDLGVYTLTVLNSEGIGQVIESGAVGWEVLATGEPYLGNGGAPSINAVTDVSKTTNSRTSLSGTLSSGTDHSADGSVSAETYSSSAVIPRYVTAGQSAVLQFTVNADPAPNAYQWTYRSAVDGTPVAISSKAAFKSPIATEKVTLASGTSAMLSIRVPATAMAGTHGFYQLTATNTKGSVLSPTVQLIVNPVPVPVVTAMPARASSSTITILKGGSLTLAVSSLSATGIYSYQWKRNGVDIASGTIGTQSTLRITNARTAQTGYYTIVVTDTQTQTTRESGVYYVTVSGTDSAKDAQRITFENTTKLRMFMCSASLSAPDLDGNVTANVVPGTKVSWVSVVPANQMLQCWRVTGDTSQTVTILPSNSASFLMPEESVTIEAVFSRPYSSMYSGFLTLEKPWVSAGNYEWTPRDEASLGNRIEVPDLNRLRGYYTCALTSTGLISGKITLEDKLYAFVATLKPDMTAAFQITLKMSDGNPWRMNGTLAFNPTEENQQADYADNSLHVTLSDALLKTPPLLNSSQTLYSRAIGSAGPTKSLSIVNPTTGIVGQQNVSGAFATLLDGIAVPGAIGVSPNYGLSYTAAVFRLNSTTGLTPASSFGQGGVFTVTVGATTGGAIVTGLHGNGTQFTYSGQLLQANYDANLDAAPFNSAASDLSVKARDVMTEAMLGNSASVVLPLFLKGDKATEPVFGACVFSAEDGANTNTLYGALGTLNAGINLTNTSEYTANYVGGYVFDPTLKPFTSVASNVTAGNNAPTVTMYTAEVYPFINPLAKWINGVSQLTSWGALVLPIANGDKTFGWTPGTASSSNTGNTGNFTLTYLESTSRYVDNQFKVYPEFAKWYDAVGSPVGYKGKSYLQSGIAGVMFCGAAPGGVQPISRALKPPFGIGFFLRGISTGASQYSGNTPQTLRDTLGNGSVEQITLKGATTHRSEGVVIAIDDPF